MSRIVGFIPNRKFWIVLAVIAVLLLAVVPAFAQDGDVPPGVSPVFTPPAPGDVVSALFLAALAAFGSAIQSPVTAPLVSLIKRIPLKWVQDASGDQVNLFVAVVVSLVTWIAVTLGMGQQVDTVWKLVVAIIPIMTGAGANFASNQSVYKWGVNKSMPVLGYARTPETKPAA